MGKNFILTKAEFLKRVNPLFKEGLSYEKLISAGIPSQIIERFKEFKMCGENKREGYFWMSIHNNYKNPEYTVDNMRDDLWDINGSNSPCGYTYTEEETVPKQQPASSNENEKDAYDSIFDDSLSYLEQVNQWFYEGFQKLFKKHKTSLTLNFHYGSLRLLQKQNYDGNGETLIFISDTNTLIATIEWQECSISGVFNNRELALTNRDFKKLAKELKEKSPFEVDVNDWPEA